MLQSVNGNGRCLEPRVPQQKFAAALAVLQEASEYAEQTSGDRWEFAVELERLRAVGLSRNDLRWLVRMHYVQHAREETLEEENGRRFRPSGDLSFTAASCFIATDKCIAMVQKLGRTTPLVACEQTPELAVGSFGNLKPQWNPEIRELWVGNLLVKRFKWQACNQEMVLTAFEEDGWPVVIDDPLPPQPEQDPKRRLHDTIKALNRHQYTEMMRFHGNGTGEGVRWGFHSADK